MAGLGGRRDGAGDLEWFAAGNVNGEPERWKGLVFDHIGPRDAGRTSWSSV